MSPILFDRLLLDRRRARAAAGAEANDFLLQRIADDVVDRLGAVRRSFPIALDLGAHHGVLARRLPGVAGIETVVSAERTPALLARCPAPRVLCDEELLPFRDASLDLVVSALTLQHVNDLPGTLAQIRRVLKPDGLMLAAVLGGATLAELRQAFVEAEIEVSGGASPRVAPFADVRDLGTLLQRAGLALPVVDTDVVSVAYASPIHLMREIRAMGASNVLVERSRRPLRRAVLARAVEIYASRFGRPDGRVSATFEIITLTGWAPDPAQQRPLAPGSARMRLAEALGVSERPAGDKAG